MSQLASTIYIRAHAGWGDIQMMLLKIMILSSYYIFVSKKNIIMYIHTCMIKNVR